MGDIINTRVDGDRAVVAGGPRVAGELAPSFRSLFSETPLREAEWIRLPHPGGRCPLTGLARTTLLELGDRGSIVIKRIRRPGATRGVVIVNKKSLLDFLDRLETEDEADNPQRAHSGLCPA